MKKVLQIIKMVFKEALTEGFLVGPNIYSIESFNDYIFNKVSGCNQFILATFNK